MAPPSRTAGRFGWLRRWRGLLAAWGSTAYVATVALWREDGHGVRTWALTLVAMGLAWSAARRRERPATLALWGMAIVVASLASRNGHPWLDAAGCAGALVAAASARWALARIVPLPGLAVSKPGSPLPAIAALVVLWTAAGAASVATALHADVDWAAMARPWGAAAAGLSGVVLLVSGLRVAKQRKLEMGVASRVVASLGLLATVTLLALGAGLIGLEDPDHIGRAAVATGGVLVAWVSLHGDGVRIAETARRVLILALVGGAVALLGAAIVEGNTSDRALAAVVTGIVSLGIGAGVKVLEDPMRPARGAWLDACAKSRDVLLQEEPSEAIRELLIAMRAPAGGLAQSPELWTFSPTRVATIDAAGYLHERDGEFPEQVIAIASAEPEATLRTEVLEALQVRRPDLRALSRWLEARDGLSATIVTRGGEPEGVLVLPCGPRWEFLTLEEARAIKRLADALAAVCQARGAHARSLERERQLVLRADRSDETIEHLRHELATHVGRHALAAQRLARPATVGIYAATSRMALEAIERRTAANAPIAILAPSGVDPVPFVARAHLGGPRAAAPLVIVDATSTREHDVARWSDATMSPLALADRGTLVLLDGAALPLDVQRLIARALSEKRPPWERAEPLDVALVFTTATAVGALVECGRLDSNLATRLGDAGEAPIALPRLCERSEDLRSILTDRLAREGLRAKGVPIGIENAAFARLVEYAFPGEDAELAAVVQQLVARASGDVVRAEDVESLALGRPAEPHDREPADSLTPPPDSAASDDKPAKKPRRRKDPMSA